MELLLTLPVLIAAFVVAVILAIVIRRSVRTVDLNEALVIVGRGDAKGGGPTGSLDALPEDGQVAETRGPRVVIGGRTFVKPFFESVTKISLEQRQIALTVEGVDNNFIKVAVRASVSFKVRGDVDGVLRAAQRFTSQQAKLEQPLQQALEGALRPVLASMPVEDIIKKRDELQREVFASIKPDLHQQGFHIDLVNLSDISTPDSDYLDNLGRAQAADARRVAEVREAQARLASESAQLAAQEEIAERQRDLALKQAGIKAQTDKANAEAEASGQRARAEQERLVATEERSALEEKAKVAEQQLDIDIRKPADAAAYAAAKEAEGERDARKAEAEADAYKRTTLAQAELEAQRNEAESITALGQARAEAARAEGLATAESTKAQAEALAQQGTSVILQQLVGQLPEVMRAAAEPVGNIDNLTVVGTDGAGAVSKIAGSVLGEGAATIKALTGIDLAAALAGVAPAASPVPSEDGVTQL
ncbi:flotillin family protein [Georgenia sunbinii]|uniref:flotillin family protein n=1 Tax=Georgenia sunbinii TaxID=3117728 RepID=UPI002F26AA9E